MRERHKRKYILREREKGGECESEKQEEIYIETAREARGNIKAKILECRIRV